MRFISFIYFLLLAYIIAAILFWGHTLDRQSNMVYENELEILKQNVDSVESFQEFQAQKQEITNRLNARKRQYMGEGVVIVLVILIGAGVVYSTIRSKNRLSQQQNNFILSITHELKSPIAAVKLNLETIKKRRLNDETRSLLIDRSVIETNRLDDLTTNLLLASKMEDRHFEPAMEPINLSEIVEDITDLMAIRTKSNFQKTIEPNCRTMGDVLLWKLVISNLLENAVKYGKSSKDIEIELSQKDEQYILSIKDYGPGIPDEEKGKIFKKFYRIGNENARKTKGTGLGLFLISKIVHQFKGSISIGNNKPTGSIFEITVPVGSQ